LRREHLRDLRRERILHGEDVGELLVELAGPERAPVREAEQLDADAHALARVLHRAVEHSVHVQLAPDGERFMLAPRVLIDGARRQHGKLRQL
jgi:hypothetical protein